MLRMIGIRFDQNGDMYALDRFLILSLMLAMFGTIACMIIGASIWSISPFFSRIVGLYCGLSCFFIGSAGFVFGMVKSKK